MAPTHYSCLLLCLLSLFVFPSTGQPSLKPKRLVLPVSKDRSTLQYQISFNQRTPSVPVKFTFDLGGQFLWVDCDKGYVSSSYKPARCGSAQCSLAQSNSCGECYSSPKPGCNNNTCSLLPGNTITHTSTIGEVGLDVVSNLPSTDGSNPGQLVSVPDFLFTCGSTFLLEGLGKGVTGMAGFGRTKVSVPSQFSAAFNFDRKFAICLSSSTGVVFFGKGPYVLLPGVDISQKLMYTPLILNPVSTASSSFSGDPSSEYFIGVTSIKINENPVRLNASLLSIDKEGNGGTKISTVVPYTVLETTIYKAVTKAFAKELGKVPRAPSVAPFGVCYNSKDIGSTRVGPGVPNIDLVLQDGTFWRIFGANSMVRVNDDVLCLGFVDGGANPRTSIVIGGHQLEDNLLQFDLANKRLGFTSSLLFGQTTCANFNFTSNAGQSVFRF